MAGTPAVLLVQARDDDPHRILHETWEPNPPLPTQNYYDLYHNRCQRLILPVGPSALRYDALIEIAGDPDDVDRLHPQLPVEELPDDLIFYTLPSRYCLSDALSNTAWELFGGSDPGWARVQAVCDWINANIEYGGKSTPLTTALDVYNARGGICRDFAHLGVTFCRALNIPARYVFGYMPDIGIPPPYPRDGLPRVVRGLSRNPLVDLRRPLQYAPHRTYPDRARTRRGGCRDGHDVRRGELPPDDRLVGCRHGRNEMEETPVIAPRRTRRMGEPLPNDTIETLIGSLETMDHGGVNWANVRWTAYLVHQHLRYEYPGEIHDLRQRLMIVPTDRYGGQRLVTHKLEVSAPFVTIDRQQDEFGNRILNLFVEHVEREIDFTAWIVVEHDATVGPVRVPADADMRARFLTPTPLTMPDDTLRATAEMLRAEGGSAIALTERINLWVHTTMSYEYGITGVHTPAAKALVARRGVCQDYAHIMIALCRLCGLPTRYVSGHLLGEGGTHAWVEVLLPDPENADQQTAYPFDPTNGCIPGMKYITVAVGRDYNDVAPTSGTFRAPYSGRLSSHKYAGVTALEYFSERD